jgi:hypothetical protein
MIQIRNRLFQPLTFHLTDGNTIHLQPRERQEYSETQVSAEIRNAARRALVDLIEVSPPQPSISEISVSEETVSTGKRRKQ